VRPDYHCQTAPALVVRPYYPVCYSPRCRFYSKTGAFSQVSIAYVTPENCPPSETGVASCVRKAVKEQYDPASGKIPAFHLTTDPSIPNFNLQSSAEDKDFGVKLRNTLHLKRNVEYCQWSEHYTQHCEQCRDGSDSNGNPKYERSCCPFNEAHRLLQIQRLQLR
jgi:hypothetical protein